MDRTNLATTMTATSNLSLQEIVIQNMFPALIQCFGIIVIGYIFGRNKILNEHGTKGLCLFVQYLSLPALIFTSLATISISNVKWQFIASILVAKIIIFIIVAISTLMMTTPVHVGKAGIYAIAATQSNDLALGYPLMISLYKNIHPTFPEILYIVVPIQLLILNPAGFFLLETHKRKTDSQYSKEHSFCHIFRGTVKNPIIVATVLGIIWNFTFHHYIPPVLSQLLQTLSIVFSPLALFLLGYNISCGIKAVKGYFSLTPGVIVLMKIFVLPLLLQKITEYFLNGSNENEIQDFSNLGFLYGTIPTAPTVFIFAKQYDVAANAMATVTVYSTLFAAPLMLASSTVISLAHSSFTNMKYYLTETICYTSAVNLGCCFLFLIVFIIKKKWQDICSVPVISIIFAQTLISISGIFYFFEHSTTLSNVHYILSLSGLFLTRFFAVFLGCNVFLLQWRSLCFVLRQESKINNLFGCIIPLGITSALVFTLVQFKMDKTWNPDFQFCYVQVVAVLCVTLFTLASTIMFLIFQHKCIKTDSGNIPTHINYQHSSRDEYSNSKMEDSESDFESKPSVSNNLSDIEDVVHEFEEIFCSIQEENAQQKKYFKYTCDSKYPCDVERRIQCVSHVQNYEQNMSVSSTEINQQCVRHIIFLLCLSSSMLISIVVCISWLATRALSGILVELQFLDIILSYGQGIVCLILFGLDFRISNATSVLLRCCRQRRLSIQSELLLDEERLMPHS